MNLRQLRHTATCASGARAEKRAACDCGATERPPAWSVRVLDDLEHVELEHVQPLTTGEAVALSLALQDLTRDAGHRRAMRRARA